MLGEPTIPSRDGYVRLTLKRLALLHFVHIASACDSTLFADLTENGIPACAAGYTEWVSSLEPVISLGWDWYREPASKRLILATPDVRSNVMLTDARGYDLGMNGTAHFIATWLSTFNWQRAVLVAAIHRRIVAPCQS